MSTTPRPWLALLWLSTAASAGPPAEPVVLDKVQTGVPTTAVDPGPFPVQCRMHVTVARSGHPSSSIRHRCDPWAAEVAEQAFRLWRFEPGSEEVCHRYLVTWISREAAFTTTWEGSCTDPFNDLDKVPVEPLGPKTRPPVPRRSPQPRWPSSSPPADPVTCTVRAHVDARGRPTSVEVLSCPTPFQDAARQAVARWRWHPGTLGDEPAPSAPIVEIRFEPPASR